MTVTGPFPPNEAGITDAHNHLWISPVPGADPGAPVLNHRKAIEAELNEYRRAGGGTIVDCQPGGCGRDGRVLHELSITSGVKVVASTGYHRRKYYAADYWLFSASTNAARRHFVAELTDCLEETRDSVPEVRAGVIKIAFEKTFVESPVNLVEAAATAAAATGAALEVHTERGADVERIFQGLLGFGLQPNRIILCHMDKRPDFGLHRALAQERALLEYDTFYRPKYQPESNVWPLLEHMVAAGLADCVAIATDMAEAKLWAKMGEGPGLAGLLSRIIPKMKQLGFSPETIRNLTGGNIALRLARPSEHNG
jgi:phosphotriesterase-related protein